MDETPGLPAHAGDRTTRNAPWRRALALSAALVVLAASIQTPIASTTPAMAARRVAALPAAVAASPLYSTDESTTTRFAVRWTAATDTALGFDIQSRLGPNGLWTDWLADTTSTAGTFAGLPGKTYHFRVRTKDGTASAGAWTEGASTVVPQAAVAPRYSGSWSSSRGAQLYLGRARWTKSQGAVATVRFVNARTISLIVTKRRDGGSADVYVGARRVTRVSFYSRTPRYRARVRVASFVLPTSGVLRVVARPTSRARRRVEINGVAVVSGTRRIFGIDSALGSLSQTERRRALSMMRAAGSRWARVGMFWPWIDRNGKAARDWSVADGYVEDAVAYDQTVIGGIHGYAAWANRRPNQPYYVPASTTEFSRFCRETVARYKDRVHYWEVWNEPNGPFWTDSKGRSHIDARAYARMLRGAYLAIKAEDPTAHVIFGGIDRNHVSFLRTAYMTLKRYPNARSNRYFFDILGVHPYCDDRPPESTDRRFQWAGMDRNFSGLPKMKMLMDAQGDRGKHIIVTEMAWPIRNLDYTKGVSKAKQAQYLARAYRMVQRWRWVDAMLWYGFKDYEWWDEEPFSLVDRNLSTRPSFKAYRTEANR